MEENGKRCVQSISKRDTQFLSPEYMLIYESDSNQHIY